MTEISGAYGQAQMTAPRPGLSSPSAPGEGLITGATQEIERAVARLSSIEQQLGTKLERIFGPMPKQQTSGSVPSPTGGAAGDLAGAIHRLHAGISALADLSDRTHQL